MTQRSLTRRDKYHIVAAVLRGKPGTVLDVGARDRILRQYLDSAHGDYFSADVQAGQDYQLDLETRLPLADASFDHVVALDVLEHVENIHHAFFELARLARRELIVGLPNMSSLPRRWSFLFRGHLGTGKYDLLCEHQGDRHRWLTIYPQINAFVAANAAAAGLELDQVYEELEPIKWFRRLGYWAARLRVLPAGWMTARCIYVLTRR